MKGGHNKKPATAHKRAGTYKPHRHAGADPKLERPATPTDLNATEQLVWEKVCGHLEYIGVISRIDDMALRLLCRQYWIMLEAWESIEEHGTLIREETETTSGAGVVRCAVRFKENPACKTLDRAHGRIIDIMRQYGLTAAARAGLKAIAVTPDADAEHEMDRILGLN